MHWGLDMGRASEVDARKVTCPLLVLAGGEDRINPPGTVERIAALYRERATYEKVARHEPLADRRTGLGKGRGARRWTGSDEI